MTQSDIGEMFGIGGPAFGHWEKGNSRPPSKSIEILETITGFSIYQLENRKLTEEEIPLHALSKYDDAPSKTDLDPIELNDKLYDLMHYGQLIQFVRMQNLKIKQLEERMNNQMNDDSTV